MCDWQLSHLGWKQVISQVNKSRVDRLTIAEVALISGIRFLEQTETHLESHALAPIAMEWNGTLASSAASRPLFSLYLAMHLSRAPQAVQWQKDDENTNTVSEQLNALNHYRRSGFVSSDSAVANHKAQADLRQNALGQSAWLQECLHPTPIHYRDDATLIDEAIQTNCPLHAQNRLRDEQASSQPIQKDPTLLVDIVPASQNML